VRLKLRDGKSVSVPLADLSEVDRNWITAQKSSDAGRPAALSDWPRTVSLSSTPNIQVIREDKDSKEFIYESDHYQFICDSMLGANLVREFCRVFEVTWLANCLLPLDFKPAPEGSHKKFQARIFTNESDYNDAGGPAGSGGVYMPRAEALMLPLSSLGVKMFGSRVTINYSAQNYSTLVHETTHQMMNHWLDKIPVWYCEGSAEYMALAKYDNGHFSFLQQDNRLRERLTNEAANGRFQMVPLEKLMNFNNREWLSALKLGGNASINYTSALALTYYFYHLDDDGKGTNFKQYIRAIEKAPGSTPAGAPGLGSSIQFTLGKPAPDTDSATLAAKYLLRGRDYKTLEKDVQQKLRRIGINVDFAE
jgi:hypothetical protein